MFSNNGNDISTSTQVIGANLENVISLGAMSSGIIFSGSITSPPNI